MPTVVFSNGSKAWANNLNDLRERWKLRREEPVKYVVPTNLFVKDISHLEREDLVRLKDDLQKLLVMARKELHKHRITSRHEGVYLPVDEYNDLSHTVDAVGLHIQVIQHVLSRQAEQKRAAIERLILDVCKERLSDDEWKEIMDEANERLRRITADGGAEETKGDLK